jgi:hypothetical protein
MMDNDEWRRWQNSNGRQLRWWQHYKMIHVHELSNDGMDNFFFSISCF